MQKMNIYLGKNKRKERKRERSIKEVLKEKSYLEGEREDVSCKQSGITAGTEAVVNRQLLHFLVQSSRADPGGPT